MGKTIKILIGYLLIFYIVIVYQVPISESYDNLTTHPYITNASIESYEFNTGHELTQNQKDWIVYGSIAEDLDPRYINHFYNPETKKGLTWNIIDKKGISLTLKGLSAKTWAQNQSSAIFDYSTTAILKNYKLGNKKRAYQGIGHILHLIQDMTVPAHTRNDPHPEGDPFESWAEYSHKISRTSFKKVNSINNVFDEVAGYTHHNFFSKDTIDVGSCDKCFNVTEKENGKNVHYLERELDGQIYKMAVLRNPDSILPVYQIGDDQKVHQSYWNLLSPRAVAYSAGTIDYFIRRFKEIDKKIEEENKKQSTFQKIINKTDNFFVSKSDELVYNFGDAVSVVLENSKENIREIVSSNKKKVEQHDNIFARSDINRLNSESNNVQDNKNNKPKERWEKVHIKYVIDGDTIILENGERVRYIGINANELNNSGPEDDECLAWQARLRNMKILNSAKNVYLVKDSKVDKDKYGRLLRYVYADNVFVNQELVKEGLASLYFCKPYWKNCNRVGDEERKQIITDANVWAKNKKVGIYSGICNFAVKNKLITKKIDKKRIVNNTNAKNNSKNTNKHNNNKISVNNNQDLHSKSSVKSEKNSENNSNNNKSNKTISNKKNNGNVENNSNQNASNKNNNHQIFIKNTNKKKNILKKEVIIPNVFDFHLRNLTKNGTSIYVFSGGGSSVEEKKSKKDPTIKSFYVYNLSTNSSTTIASGDDFTASSTVGISLSVQNDDSVGTVYYFATSTASSSVISAPKLDNSNWTTSSPSRLKLNNSINEGKKVYLWIKVKNENQDKITDSASSLISLDTVSPTTTISDRPNQTVNSNRANFKFLSNENNLYYQYKLFDEFHSSTSTDWQDVSTNTKYITANFANLSLNKLNNKKHIIQIRVTDRAGNVGNIVSYEWLVDTIAPTSSIKQLASSYQNAIFNISWNGHDRQATNTATSTISKIKKYSLQYQVCPSLNHKLSTSSWKYLKNNHAFTATSTIFTSTSSIEMGDLIYFRIKSTDNAGNQSAWSAPIYTKISKHIVISKIHITDNNDYIELYNPTDSAIDLASEGYRIERATEGMSTSNGDPHYYISIGNVGHGTYPGGTVIASKGYYLIVDANADSEYLNRANAIIDSSRGFALTENNVVYLATGPVSGNDDVDIVDYVGYGDANGSYGIKQYEGIGPVLNIIAHYSLVRKAVATSTVNDLKKNGAHYNLGNGYDSNQNGSDFVLMQDEVIRTNARNIWAEINHDAQNSRRSHLRGPHNKIKDPIKYVNTGSVGKMVIDGNNIAYFQDGSQITAISLNSDNISHGVIQNKLWTSSFDNLTLNALSNDGHFIYAKYDNRRNRGVHALNTSDGNTAWHVSSGLLRDIHIGTNNNVYFTTGLSRHVYCLNPSTGVKLFPPYSLSNGIFEESTAMSKDDILYAPKSGEGKITAVNPDLSLNWNSLYLDQYIINPVINGNGDIYIKQKNGPDASIVFISTTKHTSKRIKPTSDLYNVHRDIMAIGDDNNLIYLDGKMVHSIHSDSGKKNWQYDLSKDGISGDDSEIVTDKDGYVYISAGNKILVLDDNGNKIFLDTLVTKGVISNIIIGQNESLVLSIGNELWVY